MINIVGSGPVGSYTAYQLAKKGEEVTLFEDHDTIGAPVQCTGILTHDINELMQVKEEAIVNRIKKIDLIAPDTSFTLNLKEPELIVDRTLFDQSIAEMAEKEGVSIKTGHRFTTFSKNTALFKTKDGLKEQRFSHLIGVDGPMSRVAKEAGMLTKRIHYNAMQATLTGNFEKDTYQTFFGRNYPEFFGWIVPENEEVARIGLGTLTNSKPYFEKFLKKYVGEDYETRTTGFQHGLIPVYSPLHKIQKNNIYLVGDAATQVKATTGGGIIPGMKAGIALSDAITQNKTYRAPKKELLAHLFIRKILDRFKDTDYDQLIEYAGQQKISTILETTSREKPTALLTKAILKEPKLLKFIAVLFNRRQTAKTQ